MTTNAFQGRVQMALGDDDGELVGEGADAALLRTLVDEIDCGVMVCRADSSICYANQALRAGDPLCAAGRDAATALRCDARDAARLHAAVLLCATKGRRQLILLSRGRERLMVSVAPLRLDSIGDPRVLLMLGRRVSCSALAVEMLGAAYALTLAERRVLSGLLAEAAPREIAEALGVKLSTVRSQILSIRLKLGVRNIEGVLLRAAEVPPMAPVVRGSREGWPAPRHEGALLHRPAAWVAGRRTPARIESEVNRQRAEATAPMPC